jgi:hypothetical protein
VSRVTPELHERVLRRDGLCFAYYVLGPEHQCADQWGEPHSAADLSRMTVDHVHLEAGGVRGKRAPSDEQHLVTMCAAENIRGPSRLLRQAEREYLTALYAAQTQE